MMKTHIVLRPSPLVSLKIDTGVLPRVTGAVGVPSVQSYLNWEKKLYLKILVCYYYLEGRADKIRLFYQNKTVLPKTDVLPKANVQNSPAKCIL